jgi:membrane-associated phospholipid phosphatase
MYLGAHYPDDMTAAAIYGIFGSWAAFAVITWIASATGVAAVLDRRLPRRRRTT